MTEDIGRYDPNHQILRYGWMRLSDVPNDAVSVWVVPFHGPSEMAYRSGDHWIGQDTRRVIEREAWASIESF